MAYGKDDNDILLAGVNAKGGGQSYQWHDASTLTARSGSRGSWSVDAFAGTTLFSQGYLAYLRFTDQKRFDDAPSAIVCPAGTGGNVRCVSGPLGAPVSQRARVLSLKLSHPFASREGAGASIVFSRDTANHVNGIDLPMTLWKIDGATPLWVGIDASYTSDPAAAHRVGASLVVSTEAFKEFTRH
jgi:hypothetical protein